MPRKLLLSFLLFSGCATLFGWDIHAPGLLSENFFYQIQALPHRVALYIEPSAVSSISKNRGGALADPQTYHVGEAFVPMAIEGFQQGFQEFIYLEVPPDAAILKRYGISYLAIVRIKDLGNRVTWKGQALELTTELAVTDSMMRLLNRFEARGSSDAEKIFSKKGGPEVNLNAAIENNIIAMVHYLQDGIQSQNWKA